MMFECPCGAKHTENEWYNDTIHELARATGMDLRQVRGRLTTFHTATRYTWFMCPTCHKRIHFESIAEAHDDNAKGIRSETGWHTYDETYSYSPPERVTIPF